MCLRMCGLCPSAEWQCCTFEGTDLATVAPTLLYLRTPPVGKQFLSRYARTNFPTFPRNYSREMQPILQYTRSFSKNGYTFCNSLPQHNYERVPIVLRNAISDRQVYLF